MGTWLGLLVESVLLAVGLLLLGFGIALLVHLRRRGGLEMALTHMLADSHHRGVFLVGLCVSLGALFGIGLSDGIEVLLGASALATYDVEALLFFVGAGGMLTLMVNALLAPSPSLQEGWALQDAASLFHNAMISSTPVGVRSGLDDPEDDPSGRYAR